MRLRLRCIKTTTKNSTGLMVALQIRGVSSDVVMPDRYAYLKWVSAM
jgi:hypothetical protein